ncbi:purine and uridine phosphorylase [Mytilinidion resinicola]|uniref:Purine and uridine phosphorylase n=1 Tax=Mytilinidion resinicola TaxID=574789 RepID=A0A6A6Y8Y5_9PEZI|nr:purine and uridine phosphorylase [Mytilinidion resinicola]KAF2804424.1 purine and uridine phosphorylase [Mytilinidion resinicola]
MSRRLRREEYTVGWICALPFELAAAQEMLDEEHDGLEHDGNDENLYCLGSIAGHNVVIACLPASRIGNNPAAAVAMWMRATFRGIRFGLMVGIGGGVPSAEADIRLGDVVVSQPHQTFGGVVQYDAGKATPTGFERTASLNSPPQILLAAVARVQANELRGRSKLSDHVSKLERIPQFRRDKAGPDVLFEPTYNHRGGQTCELCYTDRQEARQPRKSDEIVVHYGTIASGNQVMRDGYTRDRQSSELGGILCFEMEAAGLMDGFPCLVIRGICDYADSHKNKRWQPYAAGTAAAYAKEILSLVPTAKVAEQPTIDNAMYRGGVSVSLTEAELISILADLARKKGDNLYWDQSIVDLLKLLRLPSNLEARKLFAEILQIHVGSLRTSIQNIALHKAILRKLAANNRRIPPEISICYACRESGHCAVNCPNKCYACGELGHWAADCHNKCYNWDKFSYWAASILPLSKEVVKAVAGNTENGIGIIARLLEHRGDEFNITEGVVKAAAGNTESGKEVIILLLDRRGNIQITEEVVKAAAGNRRSGKEVMVLLLDRKRDEIRITEGAVVEIARRFNKGVMSLLLDRRGNDVPITEELVRAAAEN